MTASIRPVQEDELHAYVDGRLAPDRHGEIALLLRDEPALRARIADWQAQQALLRDALAAKAREPVPPALHLGRLMDARLARRTAAPWRMAAGFALCLALGGGGGWLVRDWQQPNAIGMLTRQAASAHRVFAEDAQRPTELADRTQLVGWISARLGRRVAVPDLTQLGYTFLGGRLLAAMQGPAAMLVYADAAGNRVTVYLQPMRRTTAAPMRPVESTDTGDVDGVAGYAWINGAVGYSVLSRGAPPTLHRLANTVRDDMRTPL